MQGPQRRPAERWWRWPVVLLRRRPSALALAAAAFAVTAALTSSALALPSSALASPRVLQGQAMR